MTDETDDTGRAARNGTSSVQFPIVGIGASAGGVSALQMLFEALPGGLGASFVVVVHLDPQARSELAQILAASSKYGVEQVTGTSKLEPDHVYVIPPDRQLRISDHEIAAVPFEEPRGQRAPIDIFFRSLAAEKGDGCAVILTGAGSDGAVGVKAIKEGGGIVLVQDPEEAEYPSMPRSAIATEIADFVLPVKGIAERLVELVRAKRETLPARSSEEEHEFLRRILAHLRARTGHDFAHYKKTTVLRRVLRRMQVARVDSLRSYYEYLREMPDEPRALLADLLISVTTFFRDPRAFAVLARDVIPRFFTGQDAAPVRVWSAGCATGEEAYSLAILFLEEAARHEFRPEVQIFASDLDSAALAVAREGRYPAAIAADVSDERLRKFFTPDGEYLRVKRELRDMILFAGHSLLKDPPFSRIDLLSCRNLLIYLDRDMQQQVLRSLHYGLNADGYLFLGSSESAEHPAGYFRPVDREARIFRSTGRSRDQLPSLPRVLPPLLDHAAPAPAGKRADSRNIQSLHRHALEAAAPPSILVDRSWHILHLSENAGRYLLPQAGPLSTDVTDLVRPELRLELRTALHRAFERGEQTLSAALFVRFNGAAHRTYLQVKPVVSREGEAGRALVLFVESGDEEPVAIGAEGEAPDHQSVLKLQHELELMQSRLRTVREESEATTEELRAANEELQSINEEYRSTAEELETSKEELQSINEELQTVNSELKLKLEAVSRAHSDLLNLMASSDVGTLFLDPDLRIKRFTPQLARLFSITPADVGRTITDFSHQLQYDTLAEDVTRVLRDLTPMEREIQDRDGTWFILRLRPYRTIEDKIDGVVAAFVDVTERRKMEDALRQSERQLKQEMQLVELSRAPIFVRDLEKGILQWNRGSEELYGYTRAEALGKQPDELLRTEVPGSSPAALRKALLSNGIWKGELVQFAKDGRALAVESRLELAEMEGRRYVLESTRDITGTKVLEERQHLLLSELTHRVKNLLTVVQGIVHQTRRSSTTVGEFEKKLDGRITALANSQRLLVESSWQGADLRDLIENQVGPHVGDRSRIEISGDPVSLPPDVATPFGLVLHELATNAVKYGALSSGNGRVSISWRTASHNGTGAVTMVWKEMDGPAVSHGANSGFGSRLISQCIPGATVKHEFAPGGVECTLVVPLGGEAAA